MAQKTALITGCSDGGIGSALAASFQRKGYRVFAGLRNRARGSELASLPNVDIVDLDVLSASSIAAAVDTVSRQTSGSLDVLVNNAGSSLVSPLLDVDVAQARRLFDLNFWACLDMAQAFAPLLVKASGTLVNVSSIAAALHIPWSGVYCASKGAVTAMSETLRLELKPLGVSVVTGMVGTVDTPIFTKLDPVRLPEGSHYLPLKEFMENINAGKDIPQGMEVHKFADRFVSDVVRGTTGKVWRGNSASMAWFVSRYLPSSFLDMALRSAGRVANIKTARASKL